MERLISVIFAAALGGALGSFSNVLILRWHESASLMGRSHCPSCNHVIRPRHLVPIFSWLWLRGKCADCGKPIHIQYPIIELVCALLGVIAALRTSPFGATPYQFWFEFIVSIAFIVPIVMDLRWKELPVEYMVGLAVFAASFRWITHLSDFTLLSVAALCIPVVFFGLQYVLSRGKWIGSGDIWFGGVMGAVLLDPWNVGVALYAAYILGGFVAAIGLITGIFKRGSRLPFAPALATGTMIALWFGDRITAWFHVI